VVVPSGAPAHHLIRAGALRALDKSKLKNLANMDPRILQILTDFDPAIAYKLEQCGITLLDAPNDMFTVAFIYLGLDPNSQRPEDIR
jgi:spermidine/putrescine-binding protein